jgi:glycosyltransferase involved in cell wall biosynthesis
VHPTLSTDKVEGHEGTPVRIGDASAVVAMVIPCLDEAAAVGPLVRELHCFGFDQVIVVDGGSRDRTAEMARDAGAEVVVERRRGYGLACATGVAAVRPDAAILAFIDGDGSDIPAFAPAIVGPVMRGEADFALGSRLRGRREPGSLTPQQVVAGRLAGLLMFAAYRVRYTDMAPFRAISKPALDRLGMSETTYGWNLEMQMRAAARKLRIVEVPVGCRSRVGGVSKVSGNVSASLPAALTLMKTFLRLAATLRRA